MLLFFDTETTGKADFKRPASDPCQSHLVQLACQLYTLDGTRPLHSFAVVVKPEGWTIPKEASDIHGITTEVADKIGTNLSWVLRTFLAFVGHATYLVGHNVKFDQLVMEKALWEKGMSGLKTPTFCTMEAATPLCKLPGNYGNYKWPKLSEAYFHAFNRVLTHAHDALVDVRATKEIYDWLTELKLTPTSTK